MLSLPLVGVYNRWVTGSSDN